MSKFGEANEPLLCHHLDMASSDATQFVRNRRRRKPLSLMATGFAGFPRQGRAVLMVASGGHALSSQVRPYSVTGLTSFLQ